MLMDSIGTTIRKRRQELKITQRSLSELAGISINTLSRLEQGMINPQWETVEKIAVILGMEVKIEIKKLHP